MFGDEEKTDVYFIKQTIGNACGTMGLIHAILGNSDRIKLDASKHLSAFFEKTKGMTPEERGKYLETDTAFSEAHESSAQEGQTEAPDRDKKIDLHFVAFIQQGGKLYEMDGRRKNPICHGTSSGESLLEDTAAVVKKFMARDPNNLNFTLVALVQN